MTETLPIFALGVVLFPGMPLTLHIFEKRYKAMVDDCRKRGTPFGVVLIRAGNEVGATASTYHVGTAATVSSVRRSKQGNLWLEVTGGRRFRLIGMVKSRPYPQAEIQWLEEEEETTDRAQALASAGLDLFRHLIATEKTLTSEELDRLPYPADPARAAWLIAACLQVSTPEKQELLETDDPLRRLERIVAVLQRVIEEHRVLSAVRKNWGVLAPVNASVFQPHRSVN